MSNIIQLFKESLNTGFIDKSILSSITYQPELLVNQKNPPKKVLTSILHELEYCTEFYISVAFVTTSGVATIINQLKSLESRNIKGKMLVSQYLNFTQPEALKRLAQFKNIDLRITTTGNAHSKGYIFKNKGHFNLIIGSSNLTAQALCSNKEWNLKVSALDNSGIVEKVINEFNNDFKNAVQVNLDFISAYEEIYTSNQDKYSARVEDLIIEPEVIIQPNLMQIEALGNLHKLRSENKNKALIISATGTGKTYLSAFDAKNFNPKKLLFVVHRFTIAKNSLNTFKKVFGNERSMGLYSGNIKDLEADFVFSTIQTISKSKHLENFSKNHFDYIIIDETHRSRADSYLRLLEYFDPKFLLGMTATPERTDGNDIYKLFDNNIAYEIRLNKAMELDMLSPFHYYGVTDITINGVEIEKKTDFNLLTAIERVDRIIEKAKFYGSDNGITRGLVFCSGQEEAIKLSKLFNYRGLKSIALTALNSEDEREKAIQLLESDNLSEKLDYIFAVDIFNEGIDIPKVNQIIMLRPTESAIIFIQQLGRGLRKVEGKSYLTVIDFIGNYENNYLIPVALYGDTSYNKDTLRKLIKEGSRLIPGTSTVNFDEITKERIFKSIDTANMRLYTDLKNDYNLLKYKLGRIPKMMDFIEHGSRDPFLYVKHSKSLYNFILKVERDYSSVLNVEQLKLLELFSTEINNGKRVEESLILKFLIINGEIDYDYLKSYIQKEYSYDLTFETFISCINNLNFKFIGREKAVLKNIDNKLTFTATFKNQLNIGEFKSQLLDSIEYSIYTFNKVFNKESFNNGFILYQKYSRKDVTRILNWDFNGSPVVFGYMIYNNTCPIFVDYHKEDNITASTKFPEKFINNSHFLWYTKSQRKLNSKDVVAIRNHNNKLRLPLFMNKYKLEGYEYYYLGEVIPIESTFAETTIKNDKGEEMPVVKVELELNKPLETNIYKYITTLDDTEIKTVKTKSKTKINTKKSAGPKSEFVFKNPIPLYNFHAAAGTFSEMQADNDFTLIESPINLRNPNDYFACKVIGESMNKIIPNGSICLFKRSTEGSRNGKIVLVELYDIQDPDYNSAFTVKKYYSEKSISEDSWSHNSIVLKPQSSDSTFQDIIIKADSENLPKVIGEFIQVLYET